MALENIKGSAAGETGLILEIQNQWTVQNLQISHIALEKLALRTVGAAGMGWACISILKGTALFSLFAGTLVVVSVAAFYFASQIIDYEDDDRRNICRNAIKYRAEAISQLINFQIEKVLEEEGDEIITSLLQDHAKLIVLNLIREHGTDVPFQYGIPFPEDLEKVFALQISHGSLSDSLHYYNLLKGAFERVKSPHFSRFLIPPPQNWMLEKLGEEVISSDISLSDFLETHAPLIEEMNASTLPLSHFLKEMKGELEKAKTSCFSQASSAISTVYEKALQEGKQERKRNLLAAEQAWKGSSSYQKIFGNLSLLIKNLSEFYEKAEQQSETETYKVQKYKRAIQEQEEVLNASLNASTYEQSGTIEIRNTVEGQATEKMREELSRFKQHYQAELKTLEGKRKIYEEAVADAKKKWEEVKNRAEMAFSLPIRQAWEAYQETLTNLNQQFKKALIKEDT